MPHTRIFVCLSRTSCFLALLIRCLRFSFSHHSQPPFNKPIPPEGPVSLHRLINYGARGGRSQRLKVLHRKFGLDISLRNLGTAALNLIYCEGAAAAFNQRSSSFLQRTQSRRRCSYRLLSEWHTSPGEMFLERVQWCENNCKQIRSEMLWKRLRTLNGTWF